MSQDDEPEIHELRAIVLQMIDEGSCRIATSRGVANELGFSIEKTDALLMDMEANGMVKWKSVEANDKIWCPTDIPDLEPKARALLHDSDYEQPLSIKQVHEISSKYVD